MTKRATTKRSKYKWIVINPKLLSGVPTVKGTRIPVSQVLSCLAEGMSAQDIAIDYPGFPVEAVSDVLKFAAEHIGKNAAA